MSPTIRIDPLAANGFGVGKVELYDAARPRYDLRVIAHLRSLVPKQHGINVVEIGAGSGLLTRAILAHPEWDNALVSLRAIDPNEAMRSVFVKNVNDPRVVLSEGTFDNTGVESGYADLIVIAAAFHWCLDFEAAMAEFARVLKPDGALALIWYDGDRDASRFVTKVYEVERSYDHRVKSIYDKHPLRNWLTDAFVVPSFQSNFHPQTEAIIRTTLYHTLESLTKFILTLSYIAIQPEEKKLEVTERLEATVEECDRTGELVWKDKEQGIFEYPYMTMVVSARRK